MKRRLTYTYIIAVFLVGIFLTAGFTSILPILSRQFSCIQNIKTDAEKAETEKEIEKPCKEYYHLHTNNILPADIKFVELIKPQEYTDKCIQLFIRTILTPPPEKPIVT
ncbi:hypothetical protein LK994_03155 [Ferruginibacter lapsinanis]|uniref:hypothetical protein n=1 Tax=Ferruginibacter lapsinanis TaxID=563172 RepID=UPI001E2D776C|nr:hypothetical protein [Ferruginibacter lapsinanis]UEG50473.1 hypothetical protein LK994_03155 [Ferruginibacter lapsinanis]